ncbi:hypothetical protein EBR43_02355 [bacterium]|nr:hypothetical protein [bacterium]
MDLGHWRLAEGVEYKSDAFGFIYQIRNTVTDRKYIGKKQCITKLKRPPLKGKKNRRIELKESDWKSYTGSSVELNADIEKYGKDKFEFTILHYCGSKWELGYREIKEQIQRDVILREDYYNGILNVRIGSPPKNFID